MAESQGALINSAKSYSRCDDVVPSFTHSNSSTFEGRMTIRVTVVAVLVLCVFTACPSLARGPGIDDFRTATPEELAMKSVPMAPGASAVVLDWVQRHDDIDLNESEYVRIKILAADGKKWGDIEIPYVPLYTSMKKVEARTTKPDGTIVPFSGKTYEKLIVKTGGVRVIATTFSLPDVQPGSIIEYRYELGFRGEYLRDTSFTVQRELPVLRELIWLRPYSGQIKQSYSSFFVYRGLPQGKGPVKQSDGHFELSLDNVQAFEKEPYAPPEFELKPAVNFFYAPGRINVATFWLNEGKDWTTIVEDFIGNDRAAVRNAAQAVIAGATTSEQKLRNLYLRAQQVRNRNYEKEMTEAEQKKLRDNHSVEDVLRNGYGYSSEINRTLIALARAAGFEANAVRIGERDEAFFARNLPVARQLDGEVAVVKVDGKDLWLDAGTPYAPFGTVAWQKTNVPGMKLARKQEALWITTPDPPATSALTERKAVLHVEGGTLKGKVTVTYHGQEALQRRLASRNDDDAATKKAIEDGARKHFPEGATVALTKVTGMKTCDDTVVTELDVEIPNLASFAGSRALIPLSVFDAAAKNPFAETARKYEVYFDYLRTEAAEVTLQVPEGYGIETMPRAQRLDLVAVLYENHYDTPDAATLHFTRKLSIGTGSVSVDNYSVIRSFFAKVTAADQEQAVLRKTVAGAAH